MVTQNVTNKSPTIFIVDTDLCSQHILDEHVDILDQQVWLRTKELENVIAELEFTQQQMVQQEKMDMINQLTAGIAHEINNPLGFISSNIVTLGKFCERLLMFTGAHQETLISGKLDSNQAEQLQTVREQLKIETIIRDIPEMIRETMEGVERIKKIIIDLKRLSSVDDSELKLANINQCLENALNIANNEFKPKIKVKKEYGDLPRLLCYPQQLNQVFMHLLDNAVQAIDTQGEITVRSWNVQERIFVSFSDNGHGIPEHQLPRIFEPFFTTKEAGRGTGLGLSINNEIIRKHGGEIKVESEVGQGSTFTVSIPMERRSPTSILKVKNRFNLIDYEKLKSHLIHEINELRKRCATLEIADRERKQLESEIQDARKYAENIVESVREPLVVLNSDLKILTVNHSFYDTFKVTVEETIGNFIYDLGNRQWDLPKLRVLLEEILPYDTAFNGYEVDHDFQGIGRKVILLNARQIFRENIGSHIILLAMEDITERRQLEKALEETNRKFEAQSITDGLTGIANRRHFDEILAHEYSRHSRSGAKLSLILLDIDYFKLFNDSYGHVNGDECLRQIAHVITDCAARSTDLAARYGGEEFACILPETDLDAAVVIAEKIRSGIIVCAIRHNGSNVSDFVTASLGVVTVQCTVDGSAMDIVAQVDKLLYLAKTNGRNRVEFISIRGN